jgi:hypothetical protein
MVMVCSSDPSELALKTRIKIGSGSMTIRWLLSLPVSAPDGRDRASAAV